MKSDFACKFVEKVAVKCFNGHVDTNNLDVPWQSAYKVGHSVDTNNLDVPWQSAYNAGHSVDTNNPDVPWQSAYKGWS